MEGNQMKMRETMLVVRDALDTISAHEDDIEFVRAWIAQTKEAVQEAISEPPRQCDVGTPEEQKARMLEYCKSHKNVDGIIICEQCPHHGPNWTWCALRWAQTPYEAQEGGAE